MKISKIAETLNAKIINLSFDGEIAAGYCGDLLSHVMGKAPDGCCWFTVMTNVNVAAVASLANIALIVVCEGSRSNETLIDRVIKENINLIETDFDIFNSVLKVFG